MTTDSLLNRLDAQCIEFQKLAAILKSKSIADLNWKENENTWSILECLDHLNHYSEYYFPIIREAIDNSKSKKTNEFKSGIVGGYLAKSILPKVNQKKMNALSYMQPKASSQNLETIVQFENYQIEFLELISKSREVNISKIRISLSFAKLIKIKLGDLLIFLVNHTTRHFSQIEKIEVKLPHKY